MVQICAGRDQFLWQCTRVHYMCTVRPQAALLSAVGWQCGRAVGVLYGGGGRAVRVAGGALLAVIGGHADRAALLARHGAALSLGHLLAHLARHVAALLALHGQAHLHTA
jgi:hypothetical protein